MRVVMYSFCRKISLPQFVLTIIKISDVRKIAGRPGCSEGLTPVSNGNSEFTIVEHNGGHCWLPYQAYIAKLFLFGSRPRLFTAIRRCSRD